MLTQSLKFQVQNVLALAFNRSNIQTMIHNEGLVVYGGLYFGEEEIDQIMESNLILRGWNKRVTYIIDECHFGVYLIKF